MTAERGKSPQTYNLSITGMSCAGCVQKVERSLQAVAGVESVVVNFADRSASIEGNPDPAELIASIDDVGYSARIISDESADMDEKEQLERAYYKRLLVSTAVALAVGVPLKRQ